MSRALTLLSARAAELFTSTALGPTTRAPTMDDLRALSSVAGALTALATGRGAPCASVQECAGVCTRQLLITTSAFPANEDIPTDVAARLLLVIKRGGPVVGEATTIALAREVDARVSAVLLASWKPKQLLGALHSMARGAAVRPALPITSDLAHSLGYHLRQLTETESALLVWCLVTLGFQESGLKQDQHMQLWCAVCERCQLMYSRMNGISQATVAHALLLAPESMCDAQQELMHLVCATYASTDRWNLDGDGEEDGDEAQVATEVGTENGLRLRLLSTMHKLPAEALVDVVCRMWGPRLDGAVPADAIAPEEVVHALEQLARRRQPLSAESGLRVLRKLETARPLASGTAAATVWSTALDACLASATTPREVPRIGEMLLLLSGVAAATICGEARAEEEDSDVPDQGKVQAVWHAVSALTDECVRRARVGLSSGLSGPSVAALACAVTVLEAGAAAGGVIPPDCPTTVASQRGRQLCSQHPAAWGTDTRAMAECLRELCSSPPAVVALSGESTSCTGELLHRIYEQVCSSSSSSTGTPLTPAQLLELLAASEVYPAALMPVLGPFSRALAAQLGAQQFAPGDAPVLSSVASFLVGHNRCKRTVTGVSAPDEVIDLFFRLLLQLRRHKLSPQHVAALLAIFNERARDMNQLERAYMMLLTRRLGQSTALVEVVELPAAAVATLVEHACALNAASIPTSTIILSTLLNLLTDGGAVARCESLEELNEVASLLSLSTCSELEVKEKLSLCVCDKAVQLLRKSPSSISSLERAYLVAYLVRAKVSVTDGLAAALRL